MKLLSSILFMLLTLSACSQKETRRQKIGGGECGGKTYTLYQADSSYYIITSVAIPYSVKELTDGEDLHLFIFVNNDKKNKTLKIKFRGEVDTRSLQGFICDVISSY